MLKMLIPVHSTRSSKRTKASFGGLSTMTQTVFQPLPNVNVEPGLRKGRVPFEGYQRGWGLQFGPVREMVENEDLYKSSLDNIGVATWVSPEKRANLYLIMTRFLPKLAAKNIVEFGSFKGGNALFMALVMRQVAPAAAIYALDTFEGMPETDKAIDAHSVRDFSDASLDALNERIAQLNLKNIIPIKGLFQNTFPGLSRTRTFGLAHIDADIYSAIKYAQDAVWPCMTAGGYVVYDDAEISSCIGATEAVEELIQERRIHSEQVWPHFVFRVGLK
jgi:predicted O-methyltransferase YrrM